VRDDRSRGDRAVPAAARDDGERFPQPSALSRDLLFAVALVLAVFLVYEPVWHAGFIWDDEQHLTENPCIVGPLGLKEIWTTAAARICPLVQTTFWLEHAAWGLAPMPYHLVNILLHAANAVVLWRVLRKLGVLGAELGAALWAFHPVQVESAAWVTELKNTQSTFFYLLSILFFADFILAQRQPNRGPVRLWYSLSCLGGILAVASKSSTVVLPVVLALCAWWLDGRWLWRRLWNVLPFVLLSAASSALSVWTQALDIASRVEWERSWSERIAVAGMVVWFYLGKLAWPYPLIFVYPRWRVDTASMLSYAPLAAVILLLLILWAGRQGRAREVCFAFSYFVVALLPVLGLVNHYYVRYSYVGDHFQYLASMGMLALAGAGIARLLVRLGLWRQTAGNVLCLALLSVLATLSWQQSLMYRDVEKLYRTTIARNPDCWLARVNLGIDLSKRGQVEEAVAQFRQALKIDPKLPEAHVNLGIALSKRGQVEEAAYHYRKAIELGIDEAYAPYYDLGVILAAQGDDAAAIVYFRKALRTKPDFADAHNDLGLLLAKRGMIEEAATHYQKALEINPNSAKTHNNLAIILAGRGQFDEAFAHYRKALELKPDFAEADYNFAVDLANRGRLDEAIVHYRKALAVKPNYAKAHFSLGLALAGRGKIDEAMAEYGKALQIKPDYAEARRNLDALRTRKN
jgi:protein O-mannosyl-transferase